MDERTCLIFINGCVGLQGRPGSTGPHGVAGSKGNQVSDQRLVHLPLVAQKMFKKCTFLK